MAEYNVDEYNVEGEKAQYNFKISLVDNKIFLQLSEISENHKGKNYEGEFTLEELRQINKVFQLTSTIYDAQEEFKKAVERQKIALSENEAYINIMFHMILGTDNSPFVIALPRNESARIMKIEQESGMLKLERDNLFDKLEIIKRNINEVLQGTSELEENNVKLKFITKKIQEEMPLTTPIKPSVKQNIPLSTENTTNTYNDTNNLNMNNSNIDKNLIMSGNSNLNQVLSGSAYEVIDNNMNLRNQNNQSANSNNNKSLKQNPSTNNNNNLNQSVSSKNSQMSEQKKIQKKLLKKFKNGIIYNIIKTENEIINVTQRIQGYLNKNISYNLIYFSKLDGDKASTFHRKCDKVKSTLVLIKDSNGNRFGGFTAREWGGDCRQKKDEKAFIFSIDKNKIYGVLPDQVAIGCYPNFGPIFLGCQIRVYDNFFSKGGSTYLKGLNYATEEDYELTNGNQAFGIKELEVYEIGEIKENQ